MTALSCLCLCIALMACTGTDPGVLPTGSAQGVSVAAATDWAARYPHIDHTEAPYVVAIENLTLGSDYPDTEAVENAVNAITLPIINCRVDIVNHHIADHAAKVMLSLAGTERLDVFNTGLTTNLSSFVADRAVIALDGLLAERGPVLLAKAGSLLKATSIQGKIYAVPANLYPSKANGIGYNRQMAERYGIRMPKEITLKTLAGVGAALKAAAPELCLATNGDGTLSLFDVFYPCELFGGDMNYGVVFNPLVSTSIVNVYGSALYRDYCQTMKEWFDAGYLPKDAISNGLNGQEVFNSGQVLLQQMNVSPHGEQIAIKKGLPFEEILVATTQNVLSTSSVQEYAWGISSVCKRPDKAMDFLNLLYEHAELANLLSNGIEGLHYTKVSEHIIRYPDGVTGDNVGYGRIFSMFGDTLQTFQFEPATEGFYQYLKDFSAEAVPNRTLGYVFDTAEVASEIAACTSIAQEFRPMLECGVTSDVAETLRVFNEELARAGMDKIIKENQKQLDAWLLRQ